MSRRDASVGTEKFTRERFSILPTVKSKFCQTDASWLRSKSVSINTDVDPYFGMWRRRRVRGTYPIVSTAAIETQTETPATASSSATRVVSSESFYVDRSVQVSTCCDLQLINSLETPLLDEVADAEQTAESPELVKNLDDESEFQKSGKGKQKRKEVKESKDSTIKVSKKSESDNDTNGDSDTCHRSEVSTVPRKVIKLCQDQLSKSQLTLEKDQDQQQQESLLVEGEKSAEKEGTQSVDLVKVPPPPQSQMPPEKKDPSVAKKRKSHPSTVKQQPQQGGGGETGQKVNLQDKSSEKSPSTMAKLPVESIDSKNEEKGASEKVTTKSSTTNTVTDEASKVHPSSSMSPSESNLVPMVEVKCKGKKKGPTKSKTDGQKSNSEQSINKDHSPVGEGKSVSKEHQVPQVTTSIVAVGGGETITKITKSDGPKDAADQNEGPQEQSRGRTVRPLVKQDTFTYDSSGNICKSIQLAKASLDAGEDASSKTRGEASSRKLQGSKATKEFTDEHSQMAKMITSHSVPGGQQFDDESEWQFFKKYAVKPRSNSVKRIEDLDRDEDGREEGKLGESHKKGHRSRRHRSVSTHRPNSSMGHHLRDKSNYDHHSSHHREEQTDGRSLANRKLKKRNQKNKRSRKKGKRSKMTSESSDEEEEETLYLKKSPASSSSSSQSNSSSSGSSSSSSSSSESESESGSSESDKQVTLVKEKVKTSKVNNQKSYGNLSKKGKRKKEPLESDEDDLALSDVDALSLLEAKIKHIERVIPSTLKSLRKTSALAKSVKIHRKAASAKKVVDVLSASSPNLLSTNEQNGSSDSSSETSSKFSSNFIKDKTRRKSDAGETMSAIKKVPKSTEAKDKRHLAIQAPGDEDTMDAKSYAMATVAKGQMMDKEGNLVKQVDVPRIQPQMTLPMEPLRSKSAVPVVAIAATSAPGQEVAMAHGDNLVDDGRESLPLVQETNRMNVTSVESPTVPNHMIIHMKPGDLRSESKIVIEVFNAKAREVSEVTSFSEVQEDGKIKRKTTVTTSKKVPVIIGQFDGPTNDSTGGNRRTGDQSCASRQGGGGDASFDPTTRRHPGKTPEPIITSPPSTMAPSSPVPKGFKSTSNTIKSTVPSECSSPMRSASAADTGVGATTTTDGSLNTSRDQLQVSGSLASTPDHGSFVLSPAYSESEVTRAGAQVSGISTLAHPSFGMGSTFDPYHIVLNEGKHGGGGGGGGDTSRQSSPGLVGSGNGRSARRATVAGSTADSNGHGGHGGEMLHSSRIPSPLSRRSAQAHRAFFGSGHLKSDPNITFDDLERALGERTSESGFESAVNTLTDRYNASARSSSQLKYIKVGQEDQLQHPHHQVDERSYHGEQLQEAASHQQPATRQSGHGAGKKKPIVTWHETSSSTVTNEMITDPFKDTDGSILKPKTVSMSSETSIDHSGRDSTISTKSRAMRHFPGGQKEPEITSEAKLCDMPPLIALENAPRRPGQITHVSHERGKVIQSSPVSQQPKAIGVTSDMSPGHSTSIDASKMLPSELNNSSGSFVSSVTPGKSMVGSKIPTSTTSCNLPRAKRMSSDPVLLSTITSTTKSPSMVTLPSALKTSTTKIPQPQVHHSSSSNLHPSHPHHPLHHQQQQQQGHLSGFLESSLDDIEGQSSPPTHGASRYSSVNKEVHKFKDGISKSSSEFYSTPQFTTGSQEQEQLAQPPHHQHHHHHHQQEQQHQQQQVIPTTGSSPSKDGKRDKRRERQLRHQQLQQEHKLHQESSSQVGHHQEPSSASPAAVGDLTSGGHGRRSDLYPGNTCSIPQASSRMDQLADGGDFLLDKRGPSKSVASLMDPSAMSTGVASGPSGGSTSTTSQLGRRNQQVSSINLNKQTHELNPLTTATGSTGGGTLGGGGVGGGDHGKSHQSPSATTKSNGDTATSTTPKVNGKPVGTELVTRMTRTTHPPEKIYSSTTGQLVGVKPKRSKMVLEQDIQSGDGIYDRSGCHMSSMVTVDTPSSNILANKATKGLSGAARLKRKLLNLRNKSSSNKSLAIEDADGEDASNGGANGHPQEQQMGAGPGKFISKSLGDLRLEAEDEDGDANETDPGSNGKGLMVTETKFARIKPPPGKSSSQHQAETSWEYSMECNCVNGLNTSIRTNVRHKRSYVPYGLTLYESSV